MWKPLIHGSPRIVLWMCSVINHYKQW
jgi:hypothetical protein